jgi:hypothetical protein
MINPAGVWGQSAAKPRGAPIVTEGQSVAKPRGAPIVTEGQSVAKPRGAPIADAAFVICTHGRVRWDLNPGLPLLAPPILATLQVGRSPSVARGEDK